MQCLGAARSFLVDVSGVLFAAKALVHVSDCELRSCKAAGAATSQLS